MSSPRRAFDRRNAVILVLSALLLVTGVGWWRVSNKVAPPAPPVEVVQVLVAAKDLTTGTAFTKESVDQLTAFKYVSRSEMPAEAKLILSRDEMIGRRLLRATHEGEFFKSDDLRAKTQILFDAGQDILSMPLVAPRTGWVGPGSRVDLIASYLEGAERHVFTLLPNVHVLAVNGFSDLVGKDTAPDQSMVSFAVGQREALLITLANQTNCTIDLVPHRPDAAKREYDYCQTLARLKELKRRRDAPPEVAPAPRVKARTP